MDDGGCFFERLSFNVGRRGMSFPEKRLTSYNVVCRGGGGAALLSLVFFVLIIKTFWLLILHNSDSAGRMSYLCTANGER